LGRVNLNDWIVADELETTDSNPVECNIAVLSLRTNKIRGLSLMIVRVRAET
jgi:hypothetical protein